MESGLTHLFAKQATPKGVHRFESCTHRQIKYMGAYDFKIDLANAQQTEKEFVQKLHLSRKIKAARFNNDFRFDVEVEHEDETVRYEVKHDLMAMQTGNTVIEYESRGKSSGISTTQADIWVYKIGNDFYTISVPKLREVIDQGLYSRKVNGGDFGSNTRMYLFRLEVLLKQMDKLIPAPRPIKVIKKGRENYEKVN